jgi:hypothetical protein
MGMRCRYVPPHRCETQDYDLRITRCPTSVYAVPQPSRTVELLEQNDEEFISGHEWEVGGRELNGTAAAASAVVMQDVQT